MLSPAITQVSPSRSGNSAARGVAAEARRQMMAAAPNLERKVVCMGDVLNGGVGLSTFSNVLTRGEKIRFLPACNGLSFLPMAPYSRREFAKLSLAALPG